MKKIFILISLFLMFSTTYGQFLGYYPCSHFDSESAVSYSPVLNGYLIQISSGEKHELMYFLVDNNDIQKFRTALRETKKKYVEWTAVAKENNIEDYSQNMDISFPKGTVCWSTNGDPHICSDVTPKPLFMAKNGEYRLLLFAGKKVTASDNENINEKAYWIFVSVREFEKFLYLVSPEALNKNRAKKAKNW